MKRIAVVGGGIAGLACGARLAAAGRSVVLFDSGPVPGGRMTTRVMGGATFNDGAQFAAARDPDFAMLVQRLWAGSKALPWPAAGEGRWTGVPGMSALAAGMAAEAMAAGLELVQEVRLQAIRRGASWRLELERGEPAARVVREAEVALLAVPAPAAAALLRDVAPAAAARLDRVAMAPCWTLLLVLEAPLDAPDLLTPATGPIGWAARENARPGAPAGPERWVVQAGPDWSRAWLERAPGDVEAALLDALGGLLGRLPAVRSRASALWRDARTERALGEAFLWDAELGLGLCGDWCLGARVEAAWLSGDKLASRVLEVN